MRFLHIISIEGTLCRWAGQSTCDDVNGLRVKIMYEMSGISCNLDCLSRDRANVNHKEFTCVMRRFVVDCPCCELNARTAISHFKSLFLISFGEA